MDRSSAMIVVGLVALALEINFDAHFALRLATGVEVDVAQDVGLGVIAITGALGPTIHF